MMAKYRSNPVKSIVDKIIGMSGKYGPHEIFSDWIKCFAIAISNSTTFLHNKLWQDREQMYLDTINRYNHTEQMIFTNLCAELIQALEDDPRDILGDIYMQIGASSKATGQFFTPYSLSLASAKIALEGVTADLDGLIRMNEPSCGAGGMIIAASQVLWTEHHVNYQKYMDVVAQDLEWRCVYMCYVQLSLLGIKALCVQGDTLSNPYIQGCTPKENILVTPAKAGLLI